MKRRALTGAVQHAHGKAEIAMQKRARREVASDDVPSDSDRMDDE